MIEDDEASFPPTAVRWATLVALLVLAIVAYLDRQVLALLVGPIRADLKITDSQMSLLLGLGFASLYAVAGLPLGWAVDRFERRLVIFFGLAVWCVATVASSLAKSFSVLLAARVFVGMGEAALSPAAYSMISDLFPRRRLAFVMSIYMIGQQLGGTVALFVGSAVITWAAHGVNLPLLGHFSVWQTTLLACGGPGLLIGLLIFGVAEPKRRASGQVRTQASWADLIRFMATRKAFYALHFIAFSLAMAVAYAVITWTPTVLSRAFHWKPASVGLWYGTFTASVGIVGLLFNGRAVDAILARGVTDAHMRYYAVAGFVGLLSPLAILFAPTGAWFLVALIPVKLIYQFTGVSAAALQVTTPAQLRGRVSALYLMVTSLVGVALGPATVALITDYGLHDDAKVATSLAIALAIMSPLVAVLCWLGLKPMREAVDAVAGESPRAV